MAEPLRIEGHQAPMIAISVLVSVGVAVWGTAAVLRSGDVMTALAVGGVTLGVVVAGGLMALGHRCYVVADESGVTVRGTTGHRDIPWDVIDGFRIAQVNQTLVVHALVEPDELVALEATQKPESSVARTELQEHIRDLEARRPTAGVG